MNYHRVVIDPTAKIASNATMIGNVQIGKNCTVFFNAVLRDEAGHIILGEGSNIQENCTLHADFGTPVTIGKNTTIGHNAVVHSCTIGDDSLIGMGAIIMDKVVIGNECLIAAGSIVTQRMVIPDRSLVMGSPARVVRSVTEKELKMIHDSAKQYMKKGQELVDNNIFYLGKDLPKDIKNIALAEATENLD